MLRASSQERARYARDAGMPIYATLRRRRACASACRAPQRCRFAWRAQYMLLPRLWRMRRCRHAMPLYAERAFARCAKAMRYARACRRLLRALHGAFRARYATRSAAGPRRDAARARGARCLRVPALLRFRHAVAA